MAEWVSLLATPSLFLRFLTEPAMRMEKRVSSQVRVEAEAQHSAFPTDGANSYQQPPHYYQTHTQNRTPSQGLDLYTAFSKHESLPLPPRRPPCFSNRTPGVPLTHLPSLLVII